MPIAERLLTIANNTPKVCKKLFKKKTVSGSVISVGDVCSIEHNLEVNLTSDNITDFSGITVSRYGKNLSDLEDFTAETIAALEIVQSNTNVVFIPNETYTVSYDYNFINDFTSGYFRVELMYADKYQKVLRKPIPNTWNEYKTSSGRMSISFTAREDYVYGEYIWIRFIIGSSTAAEIEISNIQIELSQASTEYEPYKEPQTVTANADGEVKGLTGISPNMTIIADSNDINIQCSYRYGDNPSNNNKFIKLKNAFESLKETLKNI